MHSDVLAIDHITLHYTYAMDAYDSTVNIPCSIYQSVHDSLTTSSNETISQMLTHSLYLTVSKFQFLSVIMLK